MLLPRDFGYSWSRYKKYLAAYYDHNLNEASAAGNADDNGNDLASLAHSCIEMEGHLLFLWSKYAAEFPEHDRKIRRVSNKVTKCAQKIANVLKVESPAATLALKCITKESELICGWLTADKTSPISYIQTSNEIRQCALGFMVYKGPDYGVPMAAMMGVMKEAKVVRRFLWNIKEDNDHLDTSLRIRDRTAGVMFDICDEYFAAKDSTKGSTAGEFISIESDGKNLSEKKKELDEKDGRQETAKVDQNTKELDEKDGRQDTAKIDQNTKDYEEKEDIILDADDSIVNTYGSK